MQSGREGRSARYGDSELLFVIIAFCERNIAVNMISYSIQHLFPVNWFMSYLKFNVAISILSPIS